MHHLIERIDIAITAVGSSRSELAEAIGVTVQALSNLRRRPGSSLAPEALAKTAVTLRCDFFWLCTGEGGDYVPADTSYSPIAMRVARWLDAMSEPDRMRAVGYVAQMREGLWPCMAVQTAKEAAREARARAKSLAA